MSSMAGKFKIWAGKHPKLSFLLAVWAVLAIVGLVQEAIKSPEQRTAEMVALAARQAVRQEEQRVEDVRRAIEAQEEEAVCIVDASCIGRRHQIEAGIWCDREVASAANYAYEWATVAKLPLMDWLDENHSVIRYRGRVSFQNGFGAWSERFVTCDFNVKEEVFLGLTL